VTAGPSDTPERAALLRRYRELVLGELPRRAREGRWVVVADHCFGRIVLDNVLGGRWYDVLDRRRSPAFAQLDDGRLAAAVALAERIAVEGDPLLALPSGEAPRRNRRLRREPASLAVARASSTPAAWPGAASRRSAPAWNDPRVATPAEGLARLRAAADAGELDELCRRHRIRVLTVFGSAARNDPAARDLDVGVLLEPGAAVDYLPLIRDLELLTDADVDVVHLNGAGPVLRERALVGSVVLDESEPGAWASASTAAVLERMDTEWLRRMDLDLLADR
jgi:predicted nucleotidyltransferase